MSRGSCRPRDRTSKFGLRHWPSTLPVVFMPTSTTSTSSREARRLKKKLSFPSHGPGHMCSLSSCKLYWSKLYPLQWWALPFPPTVSRFWCWRYTTTRVHAGKVHDVHQGLTSVLDRVHGWCCCDVEGAMAIRLFDPHPIAPQASEGYLLQVNPRRGASGFFGGLKLWMRNPYHHQRVAVNRHVDSQVVDPVVMDLVQKTAMCAVLRSQGLEVQSILMDHILCRRRFAVPTGVEVISIHWPRLRFFGGVHQCVCSSWNCWARVSDRLHDHRSCIGSHTLGRAFMTGVTLLTLPYADRSYVEFTMTCGGFCALRQPIPKVSAVPFELNLTTRPPLTRTAVHSVCLVIPARGPLHLDSAHRRPHAYLNIVKTIVAEPPSPADLKLMSQVLRPLRLTLPCGRSRVHRHSLSTVFGTQVFQPSIALEVMWVWTVKLIFPPATCTCCPREFRILSILVSELDVSP